MVALDHQLAWLQPRLTPGAWEGLFHSLLDKLLARLEVGMCVCACARCVVVVALTQGGEDGRGYFAACRTSCWHAWRRVFDTGH